MERMRRLHFAAIEGNEALLSNLLNEDPLILDKYQLSQANYGTSPLHIAAKLGHVGFAKKILHAKPKLAGEVDSNMSSPLHLSCEYGHLEIVRALLNASSDMCLARDIQGRNPLHLAIVKGRFDVVKELVLAVPQAVRECMDSGDTVLHVCVKYNRLEVLKYLVDELASEETLNEKDNKGNTILHLAMANKQVENSRMDLVNEINEEMERMMRKLHLATIEGNVDLLSTLLFEDLLILHKYQLFQANCATSPLHIASKLGYIEFVDKILCAVPELVGELDSNRSSPLHLFCEYGHLERVRALLNARLDMCLAHDLQGRTPLHLAVIAGRLDVVKKLVPAMPLAVRELTGFGETVLHLCVKHTQLEVLMVLVHQVDEKEILNAKDNEGNTILHLAVVDKQLEV
ncbi:hypothetical protein Ancab_001923 [Ancistrocladus abbreviatus]